MKRKKKGGTGSQGDIKIVVYMRFGAEIRQKRASYDAKEVRDNYNNLVAINDKFDHNEDVDFSQEEVYSGMNITLGIGGLDKEEALKKIDSQIAKFEKRVNALEKHPELNVYANVWDEKRKLRELNIYKKYIKNRSENGAYFTIENGIRVYRFESLDGFLIPIWHGADNLTDYPDFTRKKKITMQETANFKEYLDGKGTKRLMTNAFIFVMLLNVMLAFGLMFGGWKVWTMHKDQVAEWEAPAEYCAKQMAETYGIFQSLLQNSIIKETIEANNETRKAIDNKLKVLKPDK